MRRLAAAGMLIGLAVVSVIPLGFAMLIADAGDDPAAVGATTSSCLDSILATMRTIESGGRYDIAPNLGGASGGYQMIDSTWLALAARAGVETSRWPHAYLAPPDVQDQVVAAAVLAFMAAGHPPADVPVYWYWPRALTDPGQMDVVPYPDAGNVLTPREYQTRWLAELRRRAGECSRQVPTGPIAGEPLELNQPEPELADMAPGVYDTTRLRAVPDRWCAETIPPCLLAPRTWQAFMGMALAARADGVVLRITSGYRTRADQQRLYNELGDISQGGLAMPVGSSPHQLGIAADIDVLPPGVYDWLRANAARWCFANAAPAIERWHWQQVWHVTGCVPA